jgi:hypothetical protein
MMRDSSSVRLIWSFGEGPSVGGFDQCYNAQAAVATGSNLVVAVDVTQAPNDKNQVEPMLDKLGALGALGETVGTCARLLADTGYYSAGNVEACEKEGIEPLIAMGRQPHHPPLSERLQAKPETSADPARQTRTQEEPTGDVPTPAKPTAVEANARRLKTLEGRKLYALRKQTPEPVFGIIKSVMGFRQFSLRGLENVRGEWSLVTMCWNIRRIFSLAAAWSGQAERHDAKQGVDDPEKPPRTPTVAVAKRYPRLAARQSPARKLSPTGC